MKRLSAKKAWEIMRRCVRFDLHDGFKDSHFSAQEAYTRLDDHFKLNERVEDEMDEEGPVPEILPQVGFPYEDDHE